MTREEARFILSLGKLRAENPMALVQVIFYDKPLDFPDKFVARAAKVTSDGVVMTDVYLVADNEKMLHEMMPVDYFYWMPRLQNDEPHILGVYI